MRLTHAAGKGAPAMPLLKHPMVCDVTTLMDVRSVLYDALANREKILSRQRLLSELPTWSLAVQALERLYRFFTVAQSTSCAFGYPTLLYLPAVENIETSGYHFSAPPIMDMASDCTFKTSDKSINLKIPRLELTSPQQEKASYRFQRLIDEELSSNREKILSEMNRILLEDRDREASSRDPFVSWQQSKLVALHTDAVASPEWDLDLASCTTLQKTIISTHLKALQLQACTRHEIVFRGLAYWAAATSLGKGFCHSPSRDRLLRITLLKQWIRKIDDFCFPIDPLVKRFEDLVLTILDVYSTEEDSQIAAYCREPVDRGSRGDPDYESIEQDKIRCIVEGWERRTWRHLMRDLLLRPGLRGNRIKTIAFKHGLKWIRMTFATWKQICGQDDADSACIPL